MENVLTGVTNATKETLLNESHSQAAMQTSWSMTKVHSCITGSLPFSQAASAMQT